MGQEWIRLRGFLRPIRGHADLGSIFELGRSLDLLQHSDKLRVILSISTKQYFSTGKTGKKCHFVVPDGIYYFMLDDDGCRN